MQRHDSMRGYFAYELHQQMAKDKDIWLVIGDLGYGMLDALRADYPDRCINVGAAEQTLVGVAVGLAMQGKKPFVYTISSFYLRAAETISLYLSHELIPVRLVGGGRDGDYEHDGYSHNGTQAQKFMHGLNINEFYPNDKESVPDMVKAMVESNSPCFISLRR